MAALHFSTAISSISLGLFFILAWLNNGKWNFGADTEKKLSKAADVPHLRVGWVLVAAFMPLIFLLVLKIWEKPNVFLGGILSMVLALQIFSGYPQIIIYEFLVFGASFILVERSKILDLKKTLFVSLS